LGHFYSASGKGLREYVKYGAATTGEDKVDGVVVVDKAEVFGDMVEVMIGVHENFHFPKP
jgi:hypothetical protein